MKNGPGADGTSFTHYAVVDGIQVIGYLDLDPENGIGEVEVTCPHCNSRNVEELDYLGDDSWVWECYDCGEDFDWTAIHHSNW